MPEAHTSQDKLHATLQVDDNARLDGPLALMLDGNVQMRTSLDGNELTPRVGMYGTLSVEAQHNRDRSLQDVRVRVENVAAEFVTLSFAAVDSDQARRYREVIAEGFSSSFGGGGPPQKAMFAARDLQPAGAPSIALKNIDMPATPARTAQPEAKTAVRKVVAATSEYGALLESLRSQSTDQLARAIAPFLEDLAEHLRTHEFTPQESWRGRNIPLDASVNLVQNHDTVIQHFLDCLDGFFAGLTPAPDEDQLWKYDVGSPDELDLIDLQVFEDFLLIDRVVASGEEIHQVPLEALTLRLATLVDVDPNELRNPIHVRQICRALQYALMRVDTTREAQRPIFDFFSKRFVGQLEHFYRPLNTTLAKHGVLPDVEAEIEEHGTLLERKKASERPDRPDRYRPQTRPNTPGQEGQPSALDDTHRQIGEQLTGALGQFTPTQLYSSVVDALNFKREAEGLLNADDLAPGETLSGTWDGAAVPSRELDQNRLADAQAIASALGAIQRDARAREEVLNSASLRAYLAKHRADIGELKDSSGLTAESLNQLDMVDNLFDTIKSQLDVSSELKPALGNLQIPLAKLALMDPRFFVEHGNSARMVVDKLSQLATSANFPNKALESRIGAIIDTIIADYETDSAVFDSALEKIDNLQSQQERALSRNIERVVKTQEGQEKLSQARREVGRFIRATIPDQNTPKALVDLIESGWRDLLVLTHVKDGTNSDNWAEQTRNLQLLCSWLAEQQAGGLDDDQSVQRTLEAQSLLDLIGQQISAALPTNISHEPVLEELHDILSGTMKIETVDARETLSEEEPEPAEVRAKIEDLPRLRRWVKRVEQLEKDHWLSYRDKEGQKKRMQLAWISPARDRYIFVNERGQKVADLSAIKLARQLSRGVQPPAPADALSAVDQSMYSTLEHVQKTLSFARNHDSLTKLINRDTFLDQMERALRHGRQRNSQHAVLYLNIDQFELVNEVYDRVSGDQVLLEFAKLLAQLHGKKSSSARIKADEFAVLLIDRNIDAAMEAAEKIRSDIAASSMDIDGENVTFTVSIGVAGISEHSASVEYILNAARTAMQLAKQNGRDAVVRYEEEQSEALQYKSQKRKTRQNLEEALATDRFVLRAQPIVKTSVSGDGDSSLHYELLLGLRAKDGSLTSPEDFINSAERYGFMTLVDRWVVREAFNWISELMDAQKVIPNLSINLSGASVTDDAFLDYLFEQISEFGVGTSRLCFEITETGTISNLVKAADFVRAFRNIGCKFSIDDFGTGLASHNYLRELPVDYVKIDGSFIRAIATNRNDYAMAKSINNLAHFLGQKTIAESVENDAIIAKLQEIGVDYLQGWGVGMPKPLVEVTEDLSSVEK